MTDTNTALGLVTMISSGVAAFLGTFITTASFLGMWRLKKDVFIQKTVANPLTNVYKLLKYTWKHSCPENRSAFTYWEEDVPPRIDLGKEKYGGPFTTEEVEDVKTFLRLLLLLASLTGFQLVDNGTATGNYLAQNSHLCPSISVLFFVVFPYHLRYLLAVVGIPLYELVWVRCLNKSAPNMLNLMRIGMMLCLSQLLLDILITFTSTMQTNATTTIHPPNAEHGYVAQCFTSQVNHSKHDCKVISTEIGSTYLLLIVPQLLSSLSYLLVFMTALEFICAQAPRTTQGMLIGLWYATISFKYMLLTILDVQVTDNNGWYIYHMVKVAVMSFSVVAFLSVAKHYKYRQRDEIVPDQLMAEEVYDRLITMGIEYEKERDSFLDSSTYKCYGSASVTDNKHISMWDDAAMDGNAPQ